MVKKRKLKKKSIILFILVISLFLGSCFFFFNHASSKKENQKRELEIKEEKQKEAPEQNYKSNLPALRNLYQNQDIALELQIPSLDLKELIVKGNDNTYYLDHDLYKKETILGAIFMDYRTLDIDEANQLNIYGHNSNYQDIPFGKLEQYQEESFFQKHRDIIIKTDKNRYNYQVFAVSLVPKDSEEHMIISLKGEEFLNHVEKMRAKALFDTQEKITTDDHILLLQTCLFNPDQFLIVFAKRI